MKSEYATAFDLATSLKGRHLAIIGAGPSIDFCISDIEECINAGFIFFISHSMARAFISRFPLAKRIIFSVENTTHNYLKGLSGEDLVLYIGSSHNLSRVQVNRIFYFHLPGDDASSHKSTLLKSPGTVLGIAMYFALYIQKMTGIFCKIFLFGADFSYPDNRIYSRFIQYSRPFSRVYTREGHELFAVIRKSTHIRLKAGQKIRCSHEMVKTKENVESMLKSYDAPLALYDFSMLGLSEDVVEKVVPSGAKF